MKAAIWKKGGEIVITTKIWEEARFYRATFVTLGTGAPLPSEKKTGLSPRGQATEARNLINIKDQIQGYPTRI